MIFSSELLPAPFAPSTPILAPGYIEMLMPRSTSLSGGCTRRRSRMVRMNCGAMRAPRYRSALGGRGVPAWRETAPMPSSASRVYEIADRYVDRYAALDPISATGAGVAGHDHELTDFSPAGAAARADLDR